MALSNTLCAAMLIISYFVSSRSPRLIPFFIFSVYYAVFFVIAPNITEDYYQIVYEREFFLSNCFMIGVLFASLLLLISGGFNMPKVPESGDARSLKVAAERVFYLCLAVGFINLMITGTPWLHENIEASRHADQGSGYLNMFTSRGLPIATAFVVWIDWLEHRRIGRKIVIFTLLTLGMLVLSAFRTYAILFVITLFVLYCFNAKRIPLVASVIVAVAGIGIFSLITIAKYENGSLETVLQAISHRVLYELIWTTQDARQIVEMDGLWWGATYVMDVVSALPGPGLSYGDYLVLFNDPGNPIAGLSPLTPSIVGESYVNFGTTGVVVAGASAPIVFVVAARLSSLSVQSVAPIVASVLILVPQLVEVGYGQVIASRLLPSAVFLFIIYWFYRRQRHRSSNRFSLRRRSAERNVQMLEVSQSQA